LSYIGSAIITLINGVLVILASWSATSRYGFPLKVLRILWKPLVASVIMGTAIYAIDSASGAGLAILIMLGIFIYIISIIIIKGLAKDDLNLIKEALHSGAGKESSSKHKTEKQLMELKNQ
jgi:hypothetical protein